MLHVVLLIDPDTGLSLTIQMSKNTLYLYTSNVSLMSVPIHYQNRTTICKTLILHEKVKENFSIANYK